MPNYKTHVNFNVFFALPLVVAGTYYVYEPAHPFLITFILAFLYGTFFMTPDLDLIHQIKFFSLRGMMTSPFRFYSRIFKHRGLSHSLLFGTATRVLWLFGVACLFFYLLYQALPSEQTFLFYFNYYKLYLIYGLAGLILADLFHIALDYLKTSK